MTRHVQLSISSRESDGRSAGDGEGVATVTVVAGAEAANDVLVTIQAKRNKGGNSQVPVALQFYLASDAAGLTPQAVAHDGGIAILGDGALIENVANLSGLLVTEADGSCEIEITDAGAFTAYLVVVLPTGELVVSNVITHTA